MKNKHSTVVLRVNEQGTLSNFFWTIWREKETKLFIVLSYKRRTQIRAIGDFFANHRLVTTAIQRRTIGEIMLASRYLKIIMKCVIKSANVTNFSRKLFPKLIFPQGKRQNISKTEGKKEREKECRTRLEICIFLSALTLQRFSSFRIIYAVVALMLKGSWWSLGHFCANVIRGHCCSSML
jgi:hypothetical protein